MYREVSARDVPRLFWFYVRNVAGRSMPKRVIVENLLLPSGPLLSVEWRGSGPAINRIPAQRNAAPELERARRSKCIVGGRSGIFTVDGRIIQVIISAILLKNHEDAIGYLPHLANDFVVRFPMAQVTGDMDISVISSTSRDMNVAEFDLVTEWRFEMKRKSERKNEVLFDRRVSMVIGNAVVILTFNTSDSPCPWHIVGSVARSHFIHASSSMDCMENDEV